jgi:exosortase
MTSAATRERADYWPALACAAAAVVLFQFLGNSTHGYLHTSSLFFWWAYQWVNPESETEHGLIILGISVWLLVRNIRLAAEVGKETNAVRLAAAAAMVGGLLLHVAGYVAEQARVSILGLLAFAWGVAALAGGRRWAAAAVFPIAFMVFAIPVNALDSAGFWLRLWVVDASSAITRLLGIHVLVSGTRLLSPDGRYDYDVAAACSGVRSLVALMALSLLIGYLKFRPFLVRAAIVLLGLPLIFVGNVVRIVAIVCAAQVGGAKWGDRAHELMGYGVFVIVLGGVVLATGLLARKRPEWVMGDAQASPFLSGNQTKIAERNRRRDWLAAGAAVSAVALTAAFLIHFSTLPERGRAGIILSADGLSPAELPTFIGADWIGKRTEVTDFERQLLPPDTGFSRKTYVSIANPAQQTLVSIVLSGHDRTSIHRPELCLVGQGWTILGASEREFEYPGRGAPFPATLLRVETTAVTSAGRTTVPGLAAYYFIGGDFIVASHWERLCRDAWNRLFHARADRWAYVLVLTYSRDGDAAALGRIKLILDSTLPSFQPAMAQK